MIPGGAVLDAALAVRLYLGLDLAAGRGGAHTLGHRPGASNDADPRQPVPIADDKKGESPSQAAASSVLLADLLLRRPPSLLLPALRVLRAMAVAVPSALARTGVSSSSVSDAAAAASGQPAVRGTLCQVGLGQRIIASSILWDMWQTIGVVQRTSMLGQSISVNL